MHVSEKAVWVPIVIGIGLIGATACGDSAEILSSAPDSGREGPPSKVGSTDGTPTETEGTDKTPVETETTDEPPTATEADAGTETNTSPSDEACCADPLAQAECWWQDAQRDGVVCASDSDCSGSHACDAAVTLDGGIQPPNGWGLCQCTTDADCNDGVCADGRCGPSFCNGYQVCSCWGGCTSAEVEGYPTPSEMCADTAAGYEGECCEGDYPSSVDGDGSTGFCCV